MDRSSPEEASADSALLRRLTAVAAAAPGLELLVLHGSRARGEAHSASDWDFAYLGDASFDPATLVARLVAAVGSERVDLADLSRASGLLRYRCARDGMIVHERDAGAFERFQLRAIAYWLDMAPVVRAELDARLDGLGA
jgi:predicted nucleotidyltransferase